MGNRIAENLACGLVGAFRNVTCTTTLDCEHKFPNVSSRRSVNEIVTEDRQNVSFQTPQDVISMTR